ncbi:MAG: phosphate/phosphite/phosphonate ABC transporter substrate-binding protein [Thiobacillus sp.]|nr:phosphate/phosphite/phosphonate ABC transporter substrate-binding protein [Thiobacillus sp.]
MGVLPYVAAKEIVETYRPIAYSLEKQLKRRVLLYTARDFKTFVERTRQGEYDVLLTAPHLAWLASDKPGYVPILKHARPVRGLLVARADAPFESLASLRGQTVASPTSVALVVLAIQSDLAAQGLKSDVDYASTTAVTHVNAAMQVVNRRVAAAILAQQPYSMIRPEFRSQLRILHQTRALPGLVYLTHPALSPQESDAIRIALLKFADSAKGKVFLQRGNHDALNPVTANDLLAMKPYAQQAQERLK